MGTGGWVGGGGGGGGGGREGGGGETDGVSKRRREKIGEGWKVESDGGCVRWTEEWEGKRGMVGEREGGRRW